MRLDGEIVAPAGLAVQWHEWASGAGELLTKATEGNRLVARADLFA
jgi:phosphoribosyl-dephospho-CoA transferase